MLTGPPFKKKGKPKVDTRRSWMLQVALRRPVPKQQILPAGSARGCPPAAMRVRAQLTVGLCVGGLARVEGTNKVQLTISWCDPWRSKRCGPVDSGR